VNVALYARVSTKDQTTDNQLIRLRQVAAARDYDIIGEYLDVASGADPKRPQLEVRLENDLNAGDCPVCDNWEDGNGNLIINRLRGYVE